MEAYNIVRFRVKPGQDEAFIDAHRAEWDVPGFKGAALVKTGEGAYCIVGRWESMDAMAAARAKMIGVLDTFRHVLEDQGGGLGVTDPVSGEVVLELPAT